MYNRYDIYMKQGVRDEAAYIKTGLEEDGDVFLSDRVGDATSSRITLLGKDGQVLFDSIENPEEMENHSNRPEFIEAEKQGSGEMVRYSDTLSKQTFYYAVKLKDDQVLRVARTTDSLLVTMLTSFLLLGGLVCVILVIELFLVQKQTRKLIEPINRIDLEHPLEHVCYEELRPLLFRLDQQNRQIQKQLEDLKNAESARKEFTANVSHELKTPIALIQGYAEGLKEGVNDDPESREFYCEVIMDEAGKMNRMVKNLLALNQLEFGEDDVQFERFDITSLISGVLQSLDILIEQKEAQVIFRHKNPVYVWADEFKVEQVVRNYVNNALNHIDGEKVIEIKITQENDMAKITVFNTGTPIPEEDLPHIWEKFYKVDKARTREYGGNGIGLSIVKAIMDSFGKGYGAINHTNGVEFWFELDMK